MAETIRVLHVEDDPEFASVTAQFLERESARIDVRAETDPADALDRLEADTVDCVVSDYDMQGMDGVGLLERVREQDARVPFILFTGKGSEEIASEALSKGATDYLQKDTGTDQYALLANRIENAVIQQRSVAELERQSEILEEAQEMADIGVAEFDLERGDVWFSAGIGRLFDVDVEEINSLEDVTLEEALENYHPDDREAVRDAVERVVKAGEPTELEVRANTDETQWLALRWKADGDGDDVSVARVTVQDITERKERERELRRTERRFEAVFEDPEILAGVLDPDGRVRDANETALSYVDADLDDLRGLPLEDTPWLPGEMREDVREWIDLAVDGEYFTEEIEVDGTGGESRRFSGSLRPVTDADGAVTSLVISARDVTERHSSQEQRDVFETLVQETTDVITVVDDDGVVQYQSPAVESMLGYDEGGMVGSQVADYLHPDERDELVEWFKAVLSGDIEPDQPGSDADEDDVDASIEHRVRDADGSWRWCETIVSDPAVSSLDDLVLTSRDVTERKHRERELEHYETVIEGLGESTFITDRSGEHVHVNTRGADITGYDEAEMLGNTPEMFYSEAEYERIADAVFDLVDDEDRDVHTMESTIQTKDGEELPVEITMTVRYDEDGRYNGTVGVIKDTTDRKETERELREYRSIMQAIPDQVTILDTDGFITRAIPPTGQEMSASGYPPEELEGKHVGAVMPDEHLERGAELIEELVTTDRERAVFEMEILTKGGERSIREDHLALLQDEDGNTLGTVGVLRDIEERKAYERELERQKERLEEFASMASHDLRNPLNLAHGYMEMVEEDCDTEYAGQVTDALDRMEQLIEDTLTWAREGASVDEREPIHSKDLVPECWEAVGTDAASLEIADDVTIDGDPARVRRVIENLLRNAVEHGGEDVTVRVGAIERDGALAGFYVADDGPGIPPGERESVFEAGYSTASDGTGFGLAIIDEICEAHGWEIHVTDSESGGARFEITETNGEVG